LSKKKKITVTYSTTGEKTLEEVIVALIKSHENTTEKGKVA